MHLVTTVTTVYAPMQARTWRHGNDEKSVAQLQGTRHENNIIGMFNLLAFLLYLH